MSSGSKIYRDNPALLDPQIVQGKGTQIIVDRPHTCLAIGSDMNQSKTNSMIPSAISSSLNSITATKTVPSKASHSKKDSQTSKIKQNAVS
jgi:hypothetical protein